jgi:N-acetylmuramoyl-L-alanine amidase
VNYKPLDPARVKFIVVHCSATPPDADVDARTIDRWHRQKGWLMIGYHWVIKRDGSVEQGRLPDQPGAHAEGFNDKSIGICLIGGVERVKATKGRAAPLDGPQWADMVPADNFTWEQKTSLLSVIAGSRVLYPKAAVIGHRDLPGVRKACPSFDVRAWLTERNVNG